MNQDSKKKYEATIQAIIEKSEKDAKEHYRKIKKEKPELFKEIVGHAPKDAKAFWEIIGSL